MSVTGNTLAELQQRVVDARAAGDLLAQVLNTANAGKAQGQIGTTTLANEARTTGLTLGRVGS
jgi:hypothetical protein